MQKHEHILTYMSTMSMRVVVCMCAMHIHRYTEAYERARLVNVVHATVLSDALLCFLFWGARHPVPK